MPWSSARVQVYLPKPASLQDGESAAQQLQQDVTAVEDLQEGNQRAAEDGVEKELVYDDVQHGPAVEVVEEEESCQNKHRKVESKISIHSFTSIGNLYLPSTSQNSIISPLEGVVLNLHWENMDVTDVDNIMGEVTTEYCNQRTSLVIFLL